MTFWIPDPVEKLEDLIDQPGIEEIVNLNGSRRNQPVAVELLMRLIHNQDVVNGLLVERIQSLENRLETLEARLDSNEKLSDQFGHRKGEPCEP